MNDTVRFSGGDLVLGHLLISPADAEWLLEVHRDEQRGAVQRRLGRAVCHRYAHRRRRIAKALIDRQRWIRACGAGE
jgi:hypothetical protein